MADSANRNSKTTATVNNSLGRTLAFATLVAVVCGTVVTLVSVLLAPAHSENRRLEQQKLLDALLLNQPGFESIANQDAAFSMAHQLVDLTTGCHNVNIDPNDYAVATNPDPTGEDLARSLQLEKSLDIANIRIRPRYALVHLMLDGESLAGVVLPVYGLGYQSRLNGYLTLAADGNTIRSLVFYAHNETPGMGGRISSQAWQTQWQDKQLRDAQGNIRIGVADSSPSNEQDKAYKIDAMSGASITGRGVTNLLRFWVGPLGFGPYLANLKNQAQCVTMPGY